MQSVPSGAAPFTLSVLARDGGHSAAFEERGIELIADHHGLPHN